MRAQEWEGRVRARWSPASSALSACCVLPQEGGADAGPGSDLVCCLRRVGPTRDRVLILCAASGGWGRRGTGFCGRQGPSAVARAGPRRAPRLSPLVVSSAM